MDQPNRKSTPSVATVTKSLAKLYVCGLRPNHTESQLRRYFAQYGTVEECCIARNSNTDESRGFGFVTFREEAQAARALIDRHHLIEGGPVQVKPYTLKTNKKNLASTSLANDKKDENARYNDEIGVPRGRRKVDELRLFVSNLKPSATQQSLEEYFSHYGTVTAVDMIPYRKGARPRDIAFVNMATPQEVEAVLKARPHQLSGEYIVVRPAFLPASKEAADFGDDRSSRHVLVVNNVFSSWNEDRVQKLFSHFGKIINVKVNPETRKAHIAFSNAEALQYLRKQKYLNINGVHLITSTGDDGTCGATFINAYV
ncbi:unnamed protein product [Hydatigera taeniaeformis]|uniref:RNA-binding domain-containing protein n=1 Tax=Hydatigena taeniaeformis TaxID=6205 RepID=A0A158RDT0_HYDTA|nr:unnamed protein product [Hydatigera taeniaeformis]